MLVWFDPFCRFVLDVGLGSREHDPLGVFEFFLGFWLQAGVAERLVGFMASLGRLFA